MDNYGCIYINGIGNFFIVWFIFIFKYIIYVFGIFVKSLSYEGLIWV